MPHVQSVAMTSFQELMQYLKVVLWMPFGIIKMWWWTSLIWLVVAAAFSGVYAFFVSWSWIIFTASIMGVYAFVTGIFFCLGLWGPSSNSSDMLR